MTPTKLNLPFLDLNMHETIVNKKLSMFSWDNPLGVSTVVHYVVAIYGPILVVVGVGLNLFADWTMQSTFTRGVPVQPLISTLLRINILTLLIGPTSAWLAQLTPIHIRRQQIFHCFILNTVHTFALSATALLVSFIVMERILGIGRPKSVWGIRKERVSRITTSILIISAAIALTDLFFLDLETAKATPRYPICLPWWEMGQVHPVWYKMMACLFSLGPGVFIIVQVLTLEVCVARFKLARKLGQQSLSQYQAMLVELTSSVQLKFANSASCLGIAFILLCNPIGLFIILGPAIHVKTYGTLNRFSRVHIDLIKHNNSYVRNISLQTLQQAEKNADFTALYGNNFVSFTENNFTDNNHSNNKNNNTNINSNTMTTNSNSNYSINNNVTRPNNNNTNKSTTISNDRDTKNDAKFNNKHNRILQDKNRIYRDGENVIKNNQPEPNTPSMTPSPESKRLYHPVTSNHTSTARPSQKRKHRPTTQSSALHPLLYSYVLVSRGDAETILWLMRYTFNLLVVPLLALTEIIFYREWAGRARQVSQMCTCRRTSDSTSFSGQCKKAEEMLRTQPDRGHPEDAIAGPYIARIDEAARSATGTASCKDCVRLGNKRSFHNVKIFDASKPARAGRNIDSISALKVPRKDPRVSKSNTADDTQCRGNKNIIQPTSSAPSFFASFRRLFRTTSAHGDPTNVSFIDQTNAPKRLSAESKDFPPPQPGKSSCSDSSSTWNVAEVPIPNPTKISPAIVSTQQRLAQEAVAVVTASASRPAAFHAVPNNPGYLLESRGTLTALKSPGRPRPAIGSLEPARRSTVITMNETSDTPRFQTTRLGIHEPKTLTSTPKSAPGFSSTGTMTRGPQAGVYINPTRTITSPNTNGADMQLLAHLAAVDARRRDFMRHGSEDEASALTPAPGFSTSDTTVLPIKGKRASGSGFK